MNKFSFQYQFPLMKSAESTNDNWLIEGIATTEHLDRENDIILRDAVRKALDEYLANPILRYMHKEPIGRVLEARYNEDGLYVKAEVIKNQRNADIWALIENGVLRSFSVMGKIKKASLSKMGGKTVRKIEDIDLYEISIVDIPANSNTFFQVVAKALEGIDFEEIEKGEKGVEMTEETKTPEWVEELKKELQTIREEFNELKKKFEVQEKKEEEQKTEKVEKIATEATLTKEEIIALIKEQLEQEPLRKAVQHTIEEAKTNEENKETIAKEADPVSTALAKLYGVAPSNLDVWKRGSD